MRLIRLRQWKVRNCEQPDGRQQRGSSCRLVLKTLSPSIYHGGRPDDALQLDMDLAENFVQFLEFGLADLRVAVVRHIVILSDRCSGVGQEVPTIRQVQKTQ